MSLLLLLAGASSAGVIVSHDNANERTLTSTTPIRTMAGTTAVRTMTSTTPVRTMTYLED